MMKTFFLRVLLANLIGLVLFAPAYGAVTGEQIRMQVVRHIEQSMPWPKEAARIEVSTPPDIAGIEPRKSSMRVETLGNEEYVGEMAFLVRILDGRQQRQTTVRARVEILRDILVSSRPLARDTILSPDDLRMKKKWVRQLDPSVLESPENAVGKRLAMDIRGGAELKSQMVREPVVVKKGKTVRINLERGAMMITTIGISEEDGTTGAMIRVRNISSNRTIYAKVTGENSVRIDY